MDTPAGFIETHRGYTAMWERDENDHWNGRYYTRAFQQASETLCCIATGTTLGAATTATRHIRFFRELRGGEALTIQSARLPQRCGCYTVLHLMRHGSTEELTATALDEVRFDLSCVPVAEVDIRGLGPRGLAPAADAPAATGRLLDRGQAVVSHLDVVRPQELDHSGQLLPSAMHGRMNEGVPHVWAHVQVDIADLKAKGLGRAMVELRIARHGVAEAGDVLQLVSWLDDVEEKRIFMRHQLENIATGEVVAGMASVTLVIDLETRRATSLPLFLRDAFAELASPV